MAPVDQYDDDPPNDEVGSTLHKEWGCEMCNLEQEINSSQKGELDKIVRTKDIKLVIISEKCVRRD
jgi:hypothetical protein